MNTLLLRSLSRLSILAGRGRTGLVRKGAWVIADQALISGTNFILMVLLARQLGPGAFGTFVIAYTAMMFANSMQSPLFTAPHNVLGATRTGHKYAHYTTVTALAQTVFSLAIGFILGLAGAGALAIGYPFAWLIIALAPACVAWQLQEFLRRVLYTHSDYRGAFLNDLIAYGGLLTGIVLLSSEGRLDDLSAVLCIAVASFVAMLMGVRQVRFHLTGTLNRSAAREELSENWRFGRWLLGGSILAWISGQLYPLLTAGFVSVGATGAFRAAQNLVAPTHVLMRGMDSVVPSRASSVYTREGKQALQVYVRSLAMPTFAMMLSYCGIVFFFAKPMTNFLLGAEYGAYAWLAQVFAILYILVYLTTLASIILRSLGRTQPTFYAYLISTPIVLTLGVVLVRNLGIAGAAIGVITHNLVLTAVLWSQVYKHLFRVDLHNPTQQSISSVSDTSEIPSISARPVGAIGGKS